jgi:UDP-N-acetylmuramoyl-L-alanyl-D-glutamate--2,6-diaminopimelate ligase
VEGVVFRAATFTNISRDHLDYHHTMEAYVAAKARLLDYLTSDGIVVVNADDPAWDALNGTRRRVRFSMFRPADVTATGIRWTTHGSEWTLSAGSQHASVSLPLLGEFNVANALAAATTAWALGESLHQVADRLASAPQVPGRLRLLDRPSVLRLCPSGRAQSGPGCRASLCRQTAHRGLRVRRGRDRARPLMGAIAESKADWAIVTSDNPRTEDPERILDDIEEGMRGKNHERLEDRRAAIARALAMAAPDDLVLLAGKGHETTRFAGRYRTASTSRRSYANSPSRRQP